MATRAKQTRNDVKRFDTLLALPLDRFRRALIHLDRRELAGLHARATVQIARAHLSRGGSGIARHRAPNELRRLARREGEIQRDLAARRVIVSAPAPLHDGRSNVRRLVPVGREDRAA